MHESAQGSGLLVDRPTAAIRTACSPVRRQRDADPSRRRSLESGLWALSEAAWILGTLERAAGSIPDLIQLLLESVDLPLYPLVGALWDDDQADVPDTDIA